MIDLAEFLPMLRHQPQWCLMQMSIEVESLCRHGLQSGECPEAAPRNTYADSRGAKSDNNSVNADKRCVRQF